MSSCSPTSEGILLTKEKALKKSMFLVESLGCPHDRSNISTILQCLLSADPYDIVTSEQVRGEAMIFTHMPIVDGRFIAEHPRKALRESHFPKMNILMGNLKVESAVFLTAYDPIAFPLSPNTLPLDERYFEESLKALEVDDGPISRKVGEFVYQVSNKTYFEMMVMGFSDYIFVCPVNEFAELFFGGDIYRYVLPHHLAKAAPAPPWMDTVHSEETLLIFGDPLRNGHLYTEEDVAFSRRVMRYWANFARTGDPNSSPDKDDGSVIYWPRSTSSGKEYLVLAPNSTSVGHDHRKKYCTFWNEVRPALNSLSLN